MKSNNSSTIFFPTGTTQYVLVNTHSLTCLKIAEVRGKADVILNSANNIMPRVTTQSSKKWGKKQANIGYIDQSA